MFNISPVGSKFGEGIAKLLTNGVKTRLDMISGVKDYLVNLGNYNLDRFTDMVNGVQSSDAYNYLEGLFTSVGEQNDFNREFNSDQAQINRDFQAIEAEKQRQWYTDMSNSAYQRSIEDLRKAGINPILAYQSGGAAVSSTGVPTGSAASYSTGGGDTLSSVLSAAADVINAMSGASASKIDSAFKIFKMAGG